MEIHGDERGKLVALENNKNIPFEIKRVYYMFDTLPNESRGFHAHKELEQIIIAMDGACCGLPVFSTRCGGVEDYITEENGRITDITDSDLLSDYLKDFLAGKIKFDSNVIRNIAVEKFGCKAFRKNMVDGFNNVLKEMNNE